MLVNELTTNYEQYLSRFVQSEREIRFGRTAMETERAGVFHIASVEEIVEIV